MGVDTAYTVDQTITHQPRMQGASEQNLMPGRYSIGVQLFCLAAFSLAFIGWLNETWLFWFDNPIWLNRYTEYGIILGFGVWRIIAEKNTYTRKRLIILVTVVTIFWWLIPWLYPLFEPYIGFLWAQPVFPSLHIPGTITFFLVLGLVFLFGRRVICGFGCPCVGIRETVGFPFRHKTLRSNWTWKLRHTKWVFFSYYVGIMVVTQFPPNSWTISFVGGFYLLLAVTYFGTFFIAPLVGNRFYCRYLCPYGATFGLLNHAGFYGISMDSEKCNGCRRCEQVCDMGIPVWQQGINAGRVTALEDCMGCARCVVSCPTDALEIQDVRNLFKKAMRQNASYLLKRESAVTIKRQDIETRQPAERVADWSEVTSASQFEHIQQQASRCLDCGHPGCMNACPLNNRIPQWLEQVALGSISKAADIAHSTSNFPEICGTLCPQHRLCEGACTKGREPEGAVTIGAIERYLTHTSLNKANSDKESYPWQGTIPEANVTKLSAKKIAIIGAGPAGLACADELNKAGYAVTVYERNAVIGGLLATGVPSFKMDKMFLKRRHRLLKNQGVVFILNFSVNNSNIDPLLNQYDAVFLGTGAQNSRDLKLPGQHLNGVTNAIDYLAQVSASQLPSEQIAKTDPDSDVRLAGQQVIVLGGGDSAIDCARSAIRQKAQQVTIIYRGKSHAMRASPKELQAAKDEGIEFRYQLVPKEIQGESVVISAEPHVSRVVFKDLSDESSIVPLGISCDMLILAVGQVNAVPDWISSLQIKSDAEGAILINQQGRTSHPKVYAGGDNTHGPDLVVTAIASGRNAAIGIMRDLQPVKQVLSHFKTLRKNSNKSNPITA